MAGLPPDPYKVLGVSEDAQLREIRSAHRRLIFECHPDRVQEASRKAQMLAEVRRVQQAYGLLSDDGEWTKYHERRAVVRLKVEAEVRKVHQEEMGKRAARLHNTRHSDTGAEYNIIAASFATRLGLKVQHRSGDERKLLRMANGKQIQTCGTVEAAWHFSNSARNGTGGSDGWRIVFHVLGGFVYDLVLGNGFLMETKTMSHFKERLARIPRPLSALSVLRMNLLGVPSQRVRGTLDSEWHSLVWALPDSGSEPNLLSWDYVQRQGWAVAKMDMLDRRLLQFADGSVDKTEGSITARWSFAHANARGSPLGAIQQDVEIEFHVMRDCPYDMILGQDVLEETDAFLAHQEAFGYVTSDTKASAMNLVIFARKKKTTTDTSEDHALHDELQRRAMNDRLQRREEMNEDVARQVEAVYQYGQGTHSSTQPSSYQGHGVNETASGEHQK
ncbi:Uu.00g048270.m01.CDS01 [Anthostomella pinea]|uniref:Uu.00g048270.m01.CDS01 n=1 Tax=Anthostomella pinea TaxID=933095 RepID=A0AAI8YC98_9PEZI|nr:Uu.00g048270.m01.CDS01 [Anthostomella pinea]